MRRDTGKNWMLAGAAAVALGCGSMWFFSGEKEIQATVAPLVPQVKVVAAQPSEIKPKTVALVSNESRDQPSRPGGAPVIARGRGTHRDRNNPTAKRVIPPAG